MAAETRSERVDTASRTVRASPEVACKALLDPASLASWLPPQGMTCEIQDFEPWEGGSFRMVLTYQGSEPTPGKSSESSDIVQGRFAELVPDARVVQLIDFVSDDPAFSGTMRMTWAFTPVPGGTEVSISAENVPYGISEEDHALGMASSLENLAAFAE